jgi:HSP20 family protein
MLTVWDSFADFDRVQRQLEKSFLGARSRPTNPAPAVFVPAVDVHEDAEALVLRAELPGVKREDIQIEVEASLLTLKGERKLEEKRDDRRYHRVERVHGTFVRQFQLPRNVDASLIDAQLADGVLTVKLPKREQPTARKIEVKGSDGN